MLLQSLEQEKKKTLAELQDRQNETAKLSQEKNSLSLATESLTENLRLIEEKTQKLLQEKAETETRWACLSGVGAVCQGGRICQV